MSTKEEILTLYRGPYGFDAIYKPRRQPPTFDREIVSSLNKKIEAEEEKEDSTLALVTFDGLGKLFTDQEMAEVNKLLKLNPHDYGVLYPHLGVRPTPDEVIPVSGQEVTFDGNKAKLPTKHLPAHVHDAYSRMYEAIQKETGRKLLIFSGYRSPAYQATVFLYWLERNDWDFQAVLKQAALLGYSQHALPDHTAVDFCSVYDDPEGNSLKHFDQTPEFEWLTAHAKRFDFHLSYPKDNEWGVRYEPWHWQYRGDGNV